MHIYFSSLERLHFAKLAPAPTPPSKHLDFCCDYSGTGSNPKTLKQRRRERQARLAADQGPDRIKRRSSHRAVGPRSSAASVYVRLPDKIKKRHLTTEEQIIASRNRRHDIILDPADEAVYKVRRRASSLTIQDELWSPTLSVRPQTMEDRPSQEPHERAAKVAEQRSSPPQKKRDSFYDSFRWLEEDDELDLRLQLDDYHANLRDDLPANPEQRRPSFRRRLSISKIPFGRTSLSSSSRPGTTPGVFSDPSSPRLPDYSSSPGAASSFSHARRRSRALSLISPKHSPQDSLAAFDPEAAHYKDPEARLKLRVYLASPQKFDEAIEFGFPSKEAMVSQPGRDAKQQPKARSPKAADETDKMRTFLADDRSSISSDDGSLDSDSPKTPHTVEMAGLRPPPIRDDQLQSPKPSTEYARMPAEAREMTLRMTLTRPDLRAHEDQMYGWQKNWAAGRKSTNGLRDDFPTATYVRDASSKESIERQFAAMDQENVQASDQGVMKRFWNKVRRGPA
ncbi:mucin [Colletotrichum graminicola M1.001]|uniref:Mucin n=1 Tax=Colletotrichum graminicola (strain M1.001 / M2 / FGSC 10212) TaxID=645133 RepID=E3QET0_COLGM|nr:mucin [Colletotrichum graminicola M1.001]EFQ29386.1 mucin [Colletotrichum graminicola M1.001]